MAISRLRTALYLSVLGLSARAWAAAPTVTTDAATALEANAATLNGTANPGGADSTGYFRYGTYNSICRDTYGTRAPAVGGAALGSGTSAVSYSQTITGLSPATQYYYCAAATNADGASFGAMGSFMTPGAPLVSTGSANSITASSAALWGTVDPRGKETTLWFRYSTVSPGTCDDTFGTRIGGYSAGSGWGGGAWGQGVYGLTPGTTYYYCIVASNSVGISFGSLVSFTTLAAPTVSTESATSVTPSSALLGGSANPGGASTTGWFRYATVNPGTCSDSFGTRAPAVGGSALGSGTSAAPYSQAITGLTPVTTLYYCAIAANSVGTSFGAVLSFTTPAPVAPTVTSEAATGVSSGAATLNGTANPGGADTTGWFRYATVSPGTCNDTFGTRAPASGGSALGSGTSTQGFSQLVSGLSPGATYYSCAIAMSSVGTSFGAVLSFTTAPAAPTVSTSAPTLLTATSAQLNGSAFPNGAGATGYFRYGTTSPGTCNDSWGTRAPTSASSDTTLGSGTSAVAYTRAITGLTPGATYYSCAIATNSVGTSFGAVISLTTPAAPPTATTGAATLLTATTAQLNGTANPGGADTTGWFRYATVSPGTCNDTFGTRAPATGGTALGAGTSNAPFSAGVTGLAPATAYYYCAIATSSAGTSLGAIVSFTTIAAPPTVTTAPAMAVSSSGATLDGSANPRGASSTGWYRYATVDPGTCDDTFGTRAPASGGSALGSGTSAVAYARAVTGLSPGTTHYYCAIAANAGGTSFGAVMSFTTLAVPPAVTTSVATAVTGAAATLNGSANPGGASTTGWFRYATVSPGTCNDTFGTRAPAVGGTALGSGTSAVAYSQAITGLAPGTTYYSCAIAANGEGTSFGGVLSFTTLAVPPAASTTDATLLTGTSAQLNGAASPGGAATTGFFRYDTADPGTCNDSFGTRAPAVGGTSLGSGTSSVPFSEGATGLSPGTTYYCCAVATSSEGTAFGAVLTFTTLAVTPTVATAPATAVGSAGATLSGAASPGGAATTGFFRYDTADPGTCNDTFGTRAPAVGGSSLGSGTSSVPFSEGVTGLAPGTPHYFCAIASNAAGTSFGAVGSFTTAAAPAVTTEAATAVTDAAATLNGSAVPNRAETTGWFRIDTADPGACNDAFGARAPAAGGSSLGAGTSSAAFSEDVTGLSPGTTYHYCAIAENAAGKRFGELLTLTAGAAPPAVTTAAPTGVTNDSAVLNGSAVPNGDASTGWFRYATVDPGVCDDAFGTRTPSTGGAALGAGTQPVAFSTALAGLTRGTAYYHCAIAENAEGMSFGAIQVAVPGTTSPVVTTEAAAAIGGSGATFAGTADPNGYAATGWFRYGDVAPTSCDDSFGARAPAIGGTSLGAGTSPMPFEESIAGLEPNLTYYYCAAASNLGGATFGEVRSFLTAPLPPVVATLTATVGTNGTVTLEGLANPRGTEATTWFRVGTADPGSCDDAFGTRWPQVGGTAVGAGRANVHYSEVADGLPPGRYFACAIGSNAAGPGFGELVTFEIPQPSSPGGGGCGCRTDSRSGGGASAVLALLALLLGATTRRAGSRSSRQ